MKTPAFCAAWIRLRRSVPISTGVPLTWTVAMHGFPSFSGEPEATAPAVASGSPLNTSLLLRLLELLLAHPHHRPVALGHHARAVGVGLLGVGEDGAAGHVRQVPVHHIDEIV